MELGKRLKGWNFGSALFLFYSYSS